MSPLTDLPQILIGELLRTTGMFLSWFKKSMLIGLTFVGKSPGKSGFPN